MEDTQILLGKVNLSIRKNLGKAIISLLLVFLCSTVLAPLAMVLLEQGLVPLGMLLLLVIPLILFMLQISFAQMCAKMYRDEPCVLGNLLDSFRDGRRCLGLALCYAVGAVVICSVVVLAGTVLALEISGGDVASFDSEAALATMFGFFPALAMLCMVVFFLLVLLPTSFTHLVLMDNRDLPLLSAIQENFRLLKGRKGRLVAFLLKTGGLWLIGTVVALVASFALVSVMFQQSESAGQSLSTLHLVSQVCDMVYFICVYTTLIRLVTAVAAFYQAVRDEESGQDAVHRLSTDSDSSQA